MGASVNKAVSFVLTAATGGFGAPIALALQGAASLSLSNVGEQP